MVYQISTKVVIKIKETGIRRREWSHSRCVVRFNKIVPLPTGRIDNWLISLSLAVKACNLLVQHANLHCVSCETTVSLPGYFRKLQAVNVPINDPGKRNKRRMKRDSRIVKFWGITRRGVVEVTKEKEETNWARKKDCKRRLWRIRTKKKKIGNFDKVGRSSNFRKLCWFLWNLSLLSSYVFVKFCKNLITFVVYFVS